MAPSHLARLLAGMGWVAMMAAGIVYGQQFPYKPIRILTSDPGGAGDFASRLIIPGMSSALGQQVVVDNRGGAVVVGEILARSSPDGYTLAVYGGTLWIGPLMQRLRYDPVNDFAPITLMTRSPNLVLVHPSVAVNSIKELIALAKAKPGFLNYGSGNSGSISHLGAELFKSMADINIVRIPYKGAGPALNALIAGEVQLMFPTAASASPHVKSGRARALAVTGIQPSILFPDLPTVSATGMPGYESVSFLGIFATARTPASTIDRLNREIVRLVKQPDVMEKFLASGAEPVGSSPAEFAATVKAEMTSMGKVIKAAGIRAE